MLKKLLKYIEARKEKRAQARLMKFMRALEVNGQHCDHNFMINESFKFEKKGVVK